jgi:ribosomal protein S18 acetylase RimI-like enzyme
MTVSFGVEFEFDICSRSGGIITRGSSAFRELVEGWDWQDDPTAALELRTPILTSMDQAISEIKRQFTYWLDIFGDHTPYPVNRKGRSLGQHVHVGRPTRPLKTREKINMAHAAANLYPLLAALHAQPIPSTRGLTSRYTAPIWEYNWDIPNQDHYCEISDSHNKTIEFRLFDANIPQVTLAACWILTKLAERAFSENFTFVEVDRERYRRDRQLGLKFGLGALDLKSYLEYFRSLVGDIRIPELQSVKEILYLAVRHRLSPSNIYMLIRPDPFKYFRAMYSNPDKYLDNLTECGTEKGPEKLGEIIRDTERNVDHVERLGDLIELASTSRPSIKPIRPLFERPPRSHVAEKLGRGDFCICRIYEVTGLSVNDVAKRIEFLISRHKIFGPENITAEEVIHSPIRYYVLTVFNGFLAREEILGTIGIRMSTGEVTALAVDRRYRRLGVGKALINYVKGECNVPLIMPSKEVD